MFNRPLKFNLTSRWRKKILNLISDQDLLEITIKRSGSSAFKIYAGIDGEKIFEMDKFTLSIGDEITVKNFKTAFDMDQ